MPEPSDHTLVEGLLASLSLRTPAETIVLTARLRERCWPGGDDRTDALAREWLRRRGNGVAAPARRRGGAGSCPLDTHPGLE